VGRGRGEQGPALRRDLEAVVDRWLDISAAHDPATDDGAESVTFVYQAYRRP
jgi:hypothetical protein